MLEAGIRITFRYIKNKPISVSLIIREKNGIVVSSKNLTKIKSKLNTWNLTSYSVFKNIAFTNIKIIYELFGTITNEKFYNKN